MVEPRPRGIESGRVERLLSKVKGERTTGDRVRALSALFLGLPYEANGLVGSRDDPEVFTASLERFDCVTYVETVLALARASDAAAFADELRRIRYDGGRVEWKRRNHYMTSWIERNTRRGAVRPLRVKTLAVGKERLLDVVPGLTPKRARFAAVPKARMGKLKPMLHTGDLVFFASTRRHLDVFHCGILVDGGGRWWMRHAARSEGGVVETDLGDFLKANRMAGVIVVRPIARPGLSA